MRTDTQLWSETYNRTLNDIFETQEEIAASVVEHLKVKLLSDVPTVQTADPNAYSLVLQGRYLGLDATADGPEQSPFLADTVEKLCFASGCFR